MVFNADALAPPSRPGSAARGSVSVRRRVHEMRAVGAVDRVVRAESSNAPLNAFELSGARCERAGFYRQMAELAEK